MSCPDRFASSTARWSPILRREKARERQRRTPGIARLAAGGECRSARPAAARRTVRAWNRDRNSSDRGRPRLVVLLTGRLIAEINRLGTNLLTVEAGQSLTGRPA